MKNSGVIIIAEAGVNHNGDLNTAFEMIDAASAAKVDYVKFQTGIAENKIELLKSIEQIKIESAQYRNHEWNIFPFLFKTKNQSYY